MRRVGRFWWVGLLLAVWAGVVRAEEPKAAPLARYFPRADLVAYVEFDGIDAHAEAWKKTATSRILNETLTGAMISSIVSQVLEVVLPADQKTLPSPEEIQSIVRTLVRSGFAFAINRKADDPSAKPSCIGLVLRGAGHGPILPTIEKALAALELPDIRLTKLEKPGGRKMTLIGPPDGPCLGWWSEKDDLVFSLIEARYADTMIAALDGKIPNALDHPDRRDLIKPENGFEPVGVAFLDARALPELPPEAVIFGLDGIKRADIRWGYQGEALMSISRIMAPGPRKGALALFDQPTFDAKTMPPLPEGVGAFTATSIDLVKVYDLLAALAKQADPKSPDLFASAEKAFRDETGRGLRDDLLGRIGPKMVFAEVPTQVFVSSNPFDSMAQSLARVPRISLLVELRDRPNFLKDLEAVAKWVNSQVPVPKAGQAQGKRPTPVLVRRLKNVDFGYEITLSPTYWPLPSGYRPSVVVGERYAAFATSPDVAKQALRQDGQLAAPLARAISNLPPNLTALSVVDTRNSALPEVLANIPSTAQWINLTLRQLTGSPFGPLGFGVELNDPAVNVRPEMDEPPAPGVEAPKIIAPVPVEPAGVPPLAPVKPPIMVPRALPGAGAVAPVAPAAPPVLMPRALPGAVAVAPVAPAAAPPAMVPGAVAVPRPVAPGAQAVPVVPGPPLNQVPQAVERAIAAGGVVPVMQEPDLTPAAPGDALAANAMAFLTFRFRMDPDEIPLPGDIRPFLFPATYSLSADASGFRITTREAWPSFNPISLAPMAIAAALPAYQSWRVTLEKEREAANLTAIGTALASYHDAKDKFPGAAICDEAGEPLLSWRVAILPFLGQKSLYDEFHQNEPWDSPHNKKLVERMPAVFSIPEAVAEPGLTHYRGLTGKGAFFDPDHKEGISLAAINDGTANTVAVVEAREAVPWTKPGTEIPFEKEGVLALLGGQKPNGFRCLLADGTVKFFSEALDIARFKALSTVAGGEVISGDEF